LLGLNGKKCCAEIASLDISRCIVRSDTNETREREFVLDRRLWPIVTSKSG